MSAPRFWREIQTRYNLIGSKCKKCSKVYFPPRIVCPNCKEALNGAPEKKDPIMEKLKLSGKGEIFTHTTVHVAPPGFETQTPYTMAIIKLEEGPKITGQVIDCNPEAISIGTKVQAVFRRIREDGADGAIYYGYKFKLATK